MLSADPAITFNGTVDDSVINTHNLIVKAVSISGAEVPEIRFNAAVGSNKSVASLFVMTGTQNSNVSSAFSDTSTNPADFNGKISIAANVTTTGNQTYTANTMFIGKASSDPMANNEINMVSQSGSITYNLGSNTNTPAGVFGIGANAKLNAFYGKDGFVTGLDVTTVDASTLSYKSDAYNPPNPSKSTANTFDAAFFSGIHSQAVQRSISNQLNNEVVEVGEIGLLKAGVLKRLDDDALCGTPNQASCKAD